MGLQDRLDRIADCLRNRDMGFFEERYIEVKKNGDLLILNYGHTTKSDRYADLCRGTIFYKDGTLAVLPLIRFFNFHESSAANIDWRTALALDKLDGSMVVAWYGRDGKWHLSTKRMVDFLPIQAFASTEKIDLAEKFRSTFPNFEDKLDPKYWYVFEAVFPENRVVTNYGTGYLRGMYGIYLLTMRHSQTLQEMSIRNIKDVIRAWNEPKVYSPLIYNIATKTQEEISSTLFRDLKEDQEGVVVVDANFNRIKIKQASYIRLHHVISNVNSTRNVINIILNGEESEVLSYFPAMKNLFDDILKRINLLKADIMSVFGQYNSLETQKEFALAVKDLPYAPFLFRLRKGEDLKYQFMLSGGKKLASYILPEVEDESL